MIRYVVLKREQAVEIAGLATVGVVAPSYSGSGKVVVTHYLTKAGYLSGDNINVITWGSMKRAYLFVHLYDAAAAALLHEGAGVQKLLIQADKVIELDM